MTKIRRVVFSPGQLSSWDAFHDSFAREFRFFSGYGRNMDAWIDCMGSLDEKSGVTDFGLRSDELAVIEIVDFERFLQDCADQARELLECTAFVNRRYIDWDGMARIAIIPVSANAT